MAGLEVEVRCYKHVQEYTLAELSAALNHLETQAAAGQGTGSWSSDQLDALRSEVRLCTNLFPLCDTVNGWLDPSKATSLGLMAMILYEA